MPNMPPLAKTADEKIGVLLLHGFSGTPGEMRPIAKHLKGLGYHVETPLLAGHGAGHRELINSTWQDWVQSAQNALNEMLKNYDQVYVAGLSMGAMLAIILAAREQRVSGIIVLSMNLGLPGSVAPPTRHLLPLVYKFPILRRHLYWTEKPPYGLKDKRMQKLITRSIEKAKKDQGNEFGIFKTYVASLYELKLFSKVVLQEAPSVQCPAFMIHSVEDTMLSPLNATVIYGQLGSREKTISLINGCDHVMTIDLRKDDVAKAVGNFIEKTSNKLEKDVPTWEVA